MAEQMTERLVSYPPGEVRRGVLQLAAKEHRSVASMAAILLQEALQARAGTNYAMSRKVKR